MNTKRTITESDRLSQNDLAGLIANKSRLLYNSLQDFLGGFFCYLKYCNLLRLQWFGYIPKISYFSSNLASHNFVCWLEPLNIRGLFWHFKLGWFFESGFLLNTSWIKILILFCNKNAKSLLSECVTKFTQLQLYKYLTIASKRPVVKKDRVD